MNLGSKNRSVGATLMNVDSSRSHSIFSIELEMMEESGDKLKAGKLNLVDLAGSERQAKTGSTGEVALGVASCMYQTCSKKIKLVRPKTKFSSLQ